MFICAGAAIAATVVFFLVPVISTSWFATTPKSFESQVVAVQSSPPTTFDIKAEFAAKQVETTAAPLAVMPLRLGKDELIRRVFPTDQIDTEEMANLLKRGRELVAAGDIPSARPVLKRAAEVGNASAALELGATYDPIVLEELRRHRLSVGNNPSQAINQVVKGRESDPETIARDITIACGPSPLEEHSDWLLALIAKQPDLTLNLSSSRAAFAQLFALHLDPKSDCGLLHLGQIPPHMPTTCLVRWLPDQICDRLGALQHDLDTTRKL
jgi:hypothetical protein